MKLFQFKQVREALAHVAAGGQAIHLNHVLGKNAPACFRQARARGEKVAHLFDRDHERLIATARRLGVRFIAVERTGTERQHVDLAGAPLRRALTLCEGRVIQ